MREHFAIDPLIGKRQQLLLATQLCRMVLKVSLPILLCSAEYVQLTPAYRLTMSSSPATMRTSSKFLVHRFYDGQKDSCAVLDTI